MGLWYIYFLHCLFLSGARSTSKILSTTFHSPSSLPTGRHVTRDFASVPTGGADEVNPQCKPEHLFSFPSHTGQGRHGEPRQPPEHRGQDRERWRNCATGKRAGKAGCAKPSHCIERNLVQAPYEETFQTLVCTAVFPPPRLNPRASHP